MSDKARVPLINPALLVSASAVAILSTDLYTPSLPHLQSFFATDAATRRFGRAAAVFGAVEMGGGALGALAVGLLHDGTAWPLASVMGGATLLAAAVFWLAAPWRESAGLSHDHGPSHDDVVGGSSDEQLDHHTEQH